MTDTFRALCAELLMALEDEGYANWYTPPDEDELCLRARALLAQPVAEGPTDKELLMLYGLTTKHLIESGRGACNHLTAFARAVLAKWGRPTPPSLKEQALAILDDCSDCLDGSHENIIRRALEELPND